MARASISISSPNDKWIQSQIENEEFSSRSEVVNDLIRKAREIETIQARLIQAEQSGFTNQRRVEILAEAKEETRSNGKL
ncbi:MAG: CopG family transcriptional regulator [Candidatus Thiodiazotropha sp. (ex Lucinoma aequizonata)]|nr:CopG family transcriptional regulator [Candidatus Thiodiazotropha sp. (ex Lucinoma aequizonata)]MCU7888693.1 CopG family transcriptional regulator [Candidatus Thiodiazotropha sp. (ex Lucinoma aequizonata)]MCU7894061.1 CopG family transcriptional regulator [Candidatus Thiodiazotropha sp. (ex Lucinoma aequizonata)]MCU7900181.1 CopG family transcriptional regulator [Candidatus Thiodiazotropha sp. (ex Lucinoma aequizonata)]MCU7901466.1 CopG family transcriptional regulator [Candidatus Thiodiazot